MPPSLSCRNAVIVCVVMRCSPLVEGFRATDVLVVLRKLGLQFQLLGQLITIALQDRFDLLQPDQA